MERDANYAAVGAFVVLVIVMAGLFIYWYSDAREHRDFTRYEIYFSGSVSGLARGSQVRYLGVDVGRVVTMRIDPRNSNRVEVIVDIDSSAPITANTIAQLSLQGVTGLLYIDLTGTDASRALLPPVASQQYPVIRSSRSNFDLVLSSLPKLTASADEVVQRAGRLLSDRNISAITAALDNVQRASTSFPETIEQLRDLTRDLRSTSENVRTVAQSIQSIAQSFGPQLQGTMTQVTAAADNLEKATSALQAIVIDNRRDLRSFTRDGLPELERLLRDGRDAAAEVRDLARSLREDPAQLLYQRPMGGVEIAQ